jgi:hypothetical protein
MRRTRLTVVVIVLGTACAIAGAAFRPTLAQAVKAAAPIQWEYAVVDRPDLNQFNKLGAEGWEMGAAEREPSFPVFVFKRQKR